MSADPGANLLAAEARAAAARTRLSATLAVAQERLRPERLARDMRSELRSAGSSAAERAAERARANPGALAGLVALAGLFLARHRIAHLLRRATRSHAGS